MKTNWLLCGLAAAGLGFALVANTQESKAASETKSGEGFDPFDPENHNVAAAIPVQAQIQVEFVEMPHEALTKLLFAAKPVSADATKLRKQVQDMVSKNETRVLETQLLVARNGQKATSESIREFIYPTEYSQPSLPCNTGESEVLWNAGPVPTAFETRNLGSTLEIEPAIDHNTRTIALGFNLELVWHTGNVVWREGKDPQGNPYQMQMPDIYSMRLNTALNCVSGQYTLAGVVSPKNDKGDADLTRKVMVFVKCDVLEVK